MRSTSEAAPNDPYRLLVQGIVDYAIYMLDSEGTIISWNAGAQRMKGYSADEVVGRTLSVFFTPEDLRNGEPERILNIAREQGKFAGEGWRVRKDGTRFWASVVVDVLRDPSGSIAGFAKITRDVTERTMVEEQRRIIVDAAPNGMLVVDAAGCITFANVQAERIFAAGSGALTGVHMGALVIVEQTDDHPARTCLGSPQPAQGRRCDGSAVPLEATFTAALTASGNVEVVSIVDVTERFAAEDERRRSQAALTEANRLMSMAEQIAHYGHWRYDLRTNGVYWSAEVYRTHGFSETRRPTLEDGLSSFDPSGVDVAQIVRQACIDGLPFHFESRIQRPDGTQRDVRVSGRAEFDAAGALIGLVGILQDVSDLKAAERERDRLIERMTLATDAAKVGIWEWDVSNDRMVWDARMFALYGLPDDSEAASYALWAQAMHPDDRDRLIGEIAAVVKNNTAFDSEFRIIWPGGAVHNIRAQATLVTDARTGTVRVVGTNWDITEMRSLADQLRDEKQRQLAYERQRLYEHERKWSTTFQRAVLPLTLPRVPGCTFDAVYEPGLGDAQVGGDWYDAVRLADGRILVSIGDVAGNGLEAAVVVGVVRQIVRGIAQLYASPMLILDAADRALSLEYPGVYVTAWIGLVDLVTSTITYASAGHPPPLIVSSGGDVRELAGTTLPIGLREGHAGEASVVALHDGDTLILYTDGVTEATKDVIAGTAALHGAAATLVHGRFQRPAERIRELVIPNGSHDDVAILVMQNRSNPDRATHRTLVVRRARRRRGEACAASVLRHASHPKLLVR